MTSPRRLALAWLLTALMVLIVVGTQALDEPEVPVLGASSFEDFEEGSVSSSGWTIEQTRSVTVERSSEQASSNKHSLLIGDGSAVGAARATWTFFETQEGRRHHVGAYAHQAGDNQYLRIRWVNDQGSTVGSSLRETSGTTGVWQRVSLDVTAPEGARFGQVQIASTNDGQGRTWWDEITLTDSSLGNADFEAASPDGVGIKGWETHGTQGASASRSPDQARRGRYSIKLSDETTHGATNATSERMRIQPSVTHTFRGWVHPTRGTTAMDILWYDEHGQLIGSRTIPGRGETGQWSLVTSNSVVAPQGARFAALHVRTSVAGTALAYWDAVSLGPTPPAAIPAFTTTDLGTPLDASARTRTSAVFVHEGRVKIAAIVTGSPAQLQMVDLESGSVEARVELPGMTNGQALVVGKDAHLYLGGNGADVYRWAPGDDTAESLGAPTPSAKTVFDLAVGPDGSIWGGSHPRGELWRINPGSGVTTNLGTVSRGQDYARTVSVTDDGRFAYVGVGSSRTSVVRVDLDHPSDRMVIALPGRQTQGVISDLKVLGDFLAVLVPAGTQEDGSPRPAERRLYDLNRHTWDVPANVPLQEPTSVDASGRFHYIAAGHLQSVDSRTGQSTHGFAAKNVTGERHLLEARVHGTNDEWLLAVDPASDVVHAQGLRTKEELSFSLHLEPLALSIKSLVEGSDGSVLVGGYGGPDVAVVDAMTGALRPSALGDASVADLGEIEGGITLDGANYMGTYTQAKIFRHDPSRPWAAGTNPVEIATLGPVAGQDRPMAWTSDGQSVFFGTVPKYGALGGGIGTLRGQQLERFDRDVIPGHSIVSLVARDGLVYGGTSRWGGLGATPTSPGARVFAYEPRTGRLLWSTAPATNAQSFGSLTLGPEGTLWTTDGGTLYEIDPANGHTLRTIVVDPVSGADQPTYRNTDLVSHRGYLYLRSRGRIYAVDPVSLRIATPVRTGVTGRGLIRVGARLLVSRGDHLMALDIQ